MLGRSELQEYRGCLAQSLGVSWTSPVTCAIGKYWNVERSFLLSANPQCSTQCNFLTLHGELFSNYIHSKPRICFCILATKDDKERWLSGVWEHLPHKGKLWWLGVGKDLMDKSVMVIHSNWQDLHHKREILTRLIEVGKLTLKVCVIHKGMLEHVFKHNVLAVEARGSLWVRGSPGLHRENLSQKTK